MKCKKCHRVIEDNSIYCNWCGYKQITDANEIKVPPPRRRGRKWYSQVMVGDNRVYISADTEEEYFAKARAAKAGLLEMKKALPRMTLGKAIDKYINDNDAVLSPSTINSYQSYRKTRFVGFMHRLRNSTAL